MTDGIIFSDRQGIIIYANQAASQLIGLPTAALLDRPITDILTRLPLLAGAGNGVHASQFELNGRFVRGQAVTFYDSHNQAQGILTTLHDVTPEYQAEYAKDNFLKLVSHELRTPLTAIKGYVELLMTGAGGALNDNQKMFTVTIQRNVNRMVQLINSLIFASSIKSGRLEFTQGHTDLPQLIRQISRELQPKAAEDGQRITIKTDKKLKPLQVDPIHMATILEELMINSIKFNRPGGKVRVTAVAETNKGKQHSFVVVSISDEGIGIAPEDQAHIFEEFYRAADLNDVQLRARGIGMGLSIVRALVEAYNGRIWFKSTPYKGSVFTFIIPDQPAQTIPSPLSLTSPAQPNSYY